MTEVAPYGTWSTPISAARVVAASVRIEEVKISSSGEGQSAIWWSEQRPHEGGRSQIVRRSPDGSVAEILPEGVSARSRVHEYGGGGWWLAGETVFYVDAVDQRVWRIDPGFDPEPLTALPAQGSLRYADGVVTNDWRWIICVQEVHPSADSPATDVVNRLVAIPSTGGDPIELWSGADFVASPRLDARSEHLSWISWSNPDMPWDATQLWGGRLDLSGREPKLSDATAVAGGPDESVILPEWDADGRLWFCSDRTDWWNLYHFPQAGVPTGEPVAAVTGSFEIGEPAWAFAQPRYAFLEDGRVVYAASSDGIDHLGAYDLISGRIDRVAVPFTEIHQLTAVDGHAVFVGAGFLSEAVITAVLIGRGGATAPPVMMRPARDLGVSSAHLSAGTPITFPTAGGRIAHGIMYPPNNPDFVGPPDERPPLVVMIHGGPTSAASAALALKVQFWTSRGFLVCDVNYRGSTGFGRRFRNELRGRWGIADIEDCVAAAAFLVERGRVDAKRCVIRGGSAGGYTTLCALTFTDAFAAGASLYGVTDLELLAQDTHKFEARYLDGLVGPYPEDAQTYRDRSPIHHVDQLDRPVILMSGSADQVVPLSQMQTIVSALGDNGVPHASIVFEGEGHGFRRAENIERAMEAELSFYLQVFGLPLPAGLERIEIVNG